MIGKILNNPIFQAVDSEGIPISGGLVYAYVPGTTTPKSTYTDRACTVADTWPVVLDANGQAVIYLLGATKINLTDGEGVQQDNFPIDYLQGFDETLYSHKYPDYSATDQGVTGNNNTIKYYIDLIGSNEGTIRLLHTSGSATTPYVLTTGETIPDNIDLIIDKGAVITGSGAVILGKSPQAGPNQIFGPDLDVSGTPLGQTPYPEWFGDTTTNINDCITAFGKTILTSYAYETSVPIELGNKYSLLSDNRQGVTVSASSGFSGTAILKTTGFDSLTGQNKWFTSNDVVYGFRIGSVTIDGGNQSIYGTQFYAKGFHVDSLTILDCLSGGWYSEAGTGTGQTDSTDMPESLVEYLSTRSCGPVGIHISGPHDAMWGKLICRGPVTKAGSTGVYIDADTTYTGNCDIDIIHSYGFEKGILIGADIDQVKIGLAIAESCTKRGITIVGGNSQIDKAELYKNNTDADAEAFNILISGNRNHISSARINDTNGGGGVKITGDRNNVVASVDCNSEVLSEGAVRVAGNHNIIDAHIYACSGAGSVALWTNVSNDLTGNIVRAKVENATIAWQNDYAGVNTSVDLNVDLASGQTVFSGTRLQAGFSNVRVIGDVAGTSTIYPQSIADIGSVDLTIDTEQLITATHNCPFQPKIQDITAILKRNTNVTDYVVDHISIESTSATEIAVRVKLGTASSTGGAVADLLIRIGQ